MKHACKAGIFFTHLRGDLGSLALFHQALGFHQGTDGFGGQLARLRLRNTIAFGRRHDAVHQTHLHRSLGHKRLTQQQRFCRSVVAHHLRHQQAGRSLGAQAQIDKRHRERGIVTCINQIAMQQHGGAHTHGGATYRSDERFGKGADDPKEAKHVGLASTGRGTQKIANVVARAEHANVALDDHGANFGIALSLGERVGQGTVHRCGDRVLFVNPVESNGLHTGFGVAQDIGHGWVPWDEKMDVD